MKKNKGFTLLDLIISVAIIAMVAIIATGNNTHCYAGYVYTVDGNGTHHQVINEQGGGISCTKDSE
ncbi:MAG: prepilin-type N-terminal cleavage/methylation domain-containing protein [Nitrososphaeraceae archaeon]